MKQDDEIQALIGRVRAKLPAAASNTDKRLLQRGYEKSDLDSLHYLWVEALADTTNDAARAKDAISVIEQSGFMASEYSNGSAAVKRAVDVSYAESLMWDLSNEDKKWVWPHFPKVVRDLYVEMWGTPDF